ncbi:MAG: bifunctional ornithine acetyltransferase/N-acetylglutamate synthase [Oscillospiraceae bacterium]|nr:bifunctional ornithine acetyltransferase/N-acetylglutamate synthase [Oscillospiraceae bacterium]
MESIKQIPGGVCAPKGFKAAGIHCGIAKKVDKKDLALIFSEAPGSCAAVLTTNKVQAAPIRVTQNHLANGTAQAFLCNSGNANACTLDGDKVANQMCEIAARELNIPPEDVVVASTGVIGQALSIHPVDAGMKQLVRLLDRSGGEDAARAIMTTDLLKKEISVCFEIGGAECRMGAAAKGSGMINPNMATMLAFITTDTAISPQMLRAAISTVTQDTFNMVSVDGDTSTNDMAAVLANGMAANPLIQAPGEDYDSFLKALTYVCIYLARMIAKDGEGATKLLECSVKGAKDESSARVLAKSVISSNLVKAAMFGGDANWGRILCAMGYSGAQFDPQRVSLYFSSGAGTILVCKDGAGLPFTEERAAAILSEPEIELQLVLGDGEGEAVAWGCDLTYDYVKINGDYRS